MAQFYTQKISEKYRRHTIVTFRQEVVLPLVLSSNSSYCSAVVMRLSMHPQVAAICRWMHAFWQSTSVYLHKRSISSHALPLIHNIHQRRPHRRLITGLFTGPIICIGVFTRPHTDIALRIFCTQINNDSYHDSAAMRSPLLLRFI